MTDAQSMNVGTFSNDGNHYNIVSDYFFMWFFVTGIPIINSSLAGPERIVMLHAVVLFCIVKNEQQSANPLSSLSALEKYVLRSDDISQRRRIFTCC